VRVIVDHVLLVTGAFLIAIALLQLNGMQEALVTRRLENSLPDRRFNFMQLKFRGGDQT
jgi:hypothetical protein